MANPVLMLLEGNGSLAGRDRAGAFTATGSGALRYAPANGARINYFPNPGLGSNSTGMNAAGSATCARTADTDFSSGYCYEIAATASTSDGANLFTLNRPSVTWSAATFTVSFDAKLTAGASDWQVFIANTDATGTKIGSNGTAVDFVPGASVGRVSVQVTMPTQAGSHGALIAIRRKTAATGTIRASDFTIEVGTTSGTAITNPVWLDPITGVLGTAHASPSVSRATFWIEEATTNLFRNPVANSATTDAAVTAGFTLSRSTTTAYFGSASFKVDTDGTAAKRVVFETPHSLGYTGSTRTFIGSVYLRGTSNVYIDLAVVYTDLSVTTTSNVTLTLTDAWQRLVSPSLTIDSAKTVDYLVMSVRLNGAQSAATYYCNAVQIEEKAYATSYCDGTLGTGYSWSGTAHASSSSRTAATDSSATTNRINIPAGSALFRYLRSVDTSTEEIYGEVGTKGGGTDHVRWGVDSSDRAFVEWSANNAAYQRVTRTGALSIGTKYIWYIDWNSTAVNLSLGTESLTSGTRAAASGSWGAGDIVLEGAPGGQYVGPVAIYDRPLTAAERAKVNAAIDSNGAASLWTVLGSNSYRNFQLRPISQ